MPRMPMIAATPLLLLLLLVFSPAWAKPTIRTNPTNEPFPIQEESTASFAEHDAYTMTVEVDPDIVLTTEDSMQLFTQLADHTGTTTEEPLPESVLLQLEQERFEREKKLREVNASITTEDPTKELKKNNATKKATTTKTRLDAETTTKATPAKTTMSWMTTTPKFIETAFVKSIASLNEEPVEPADEQATHEDSPNNFNPIESNFNPIDTEKDLERGDSKTHSVVETTTYLPQGDDFTTVNSNRDEPASTEMPELRSELPSTLAPVKEPFQFTSRPFMSELSEFGTESMLLEQTTWLPDLALLVESTVQPELMVHSTDKALPAIEPLASTTTEVPGETTATNEFAEVAENTTLLPKPIKMVEKTTTSTTEQPTTVQPTTEPSTTAATTTEATTTSAAIEATTLPVTTTESPKFQQVVDTTTSTTTSTPSSTTSTTSTPSTTTSTASSSDTTSTTSSTTSTTPEATTVTEPALQETTIAAPKQQVLLEAVATTARPVETTTAEAPLPTTQQARVPPTRAPRVERIFNPDGVEVLYGYSSVVRTNRA